MPVMTNVAVRVGPVPELPIGAVHRIVIFHYHIPIWYFLTEAVYLLIVVALSIAILARTRRFYALTKHPGILVFRLAVLALGVAYAFRFLLLVPLLFGLGPLRSAFVPFSFALATFASTYAILLLTLTILIRNRHRLLLGIVPFIAAFVSIIAFLAHADALLLEIQAILIIASIIALWSVRTPSPRQSTVMVLYSLLFATWVLNELLVVPIVRLSFPITIILYAISALTFVLIYANVQRRTRIHGEKA